VSDAPFDPTPSNAVTRWWQGWDTGHDEFATLRWENDGWTIEGKLPTAEVDYVIRLGSDGEIRQFMLFRDLEEPDLWLAHDGSGRWGEVNGAERPDLEGCVAVGPANTVMLLSLPIRRLGVWAAAGEQFTARLAIVDTETLGVTAHEHRFERRGAQLWAIDSTRLGAIEGAIDDDFLFVDLPGVGRRLG
jgi:uncharacterized protein